MKPIKLKITERYPIGEDSKVVTDSYVVEILESRIAKIAEVDDMVWGDNRIKGKEYEYEYLCILQMSDGGEALMTLHQDELDNARVKVIRD